MPRLAQTTDLPRVLERHRQRSQPWWPSQEPEETTTLVLEHSPLAEFDILITEENDGVSGFLLLKRQLTRGLTGDRESVVYDHWATTAQGRQRLFESAVRAARGHGSTYLTHPLAPHDTSTKSLLLSLGFQLESQRISVASGEPRIPPDSPYEIRPATEEDAFMIGVLNSTMLEHTLAAGRQYDMADLTMKSMGAIMSHVARRDAHSAGLVLTKNGTMVGHLLLELNERRGYIYDLALEQEHWGGTAVRHLMRAGSLLLHQRQIPLFVGDVSAGNRRALVVAQRALGFQVDFERWGLSL